MTIPTKVDRIHPSDPNLTTCPDVPVLVAIRPLVATPFMAPTSGAAHCARRDRGLSQRTLDGGLLRPTCERQQSAHGVSITHRLRDGHLARPRLSGLSRTEHPSPPRMDNAGLRARAGSRYTSDHTRFGTSWSPNRPLVLERFSWVPTRASTSPLMVDHPQP
jgi:hypothetical protein